MDEEEIISAPILPPGESESPDCSNGQFDHSDNDSEEDHSDYNGMSESDRIEDDSGKKRKYKYVNRKRKVTPTRDRLSNWTATLDAMTEAKLRRMYCCRKLRCFKEVNYDYFLERARHIVTSSPAVRRTILISMTDADNNYVFNSRRVCVRFMKKSFRFSTELLAQDRKSGVHQEAGSANRSGNINIPTVSVSSSSASSGLIRSSPHKDAIISFLLRLSEDCSEKMPDVNELHLPFFQKGEVYAHFVEEYKKLYDDSVPSSHYFFFVWKSEVAHIKVRKATRFTVCDICEEIRAGMQNAILKGQNMDQLLSKKAAHIKMVRDERMEYQKKRDRARLHPGDYCSIIADGADQSAFGIPHFMTKTKEQKGISLKVKVIGLLEHGVENHLMIFTMTEDHETGANHIVESIHRFLNSRRNRGPIPRKFFVQLDNCTRENKNTFLLSYLESLVCMDIFDIVEVGFLPKGHTHEDIDQCFSQSSGRLRHSNAITLADLQNELSKINENRTEVCHLKRVANWSGLCTQEKCLHPVKNFTQFRYFKFSRSFQTSEDEGLYGFSTSCHVRRSCYDKWEPISKRNHPSHFNGFLKFCPDIRKVPPLKIKCPEGLDKVTKRFISEEGRINNSDKMIELQELRDFVFRNRVDPFHWEVSSIIETSRSKLYQQGEEDPIESRDDGVGDEDEITRNFGDDRNHSSEINDAQANEANNAVLSAPASRFTYKKLSFVVIKCGEEGGSTNFWIGKVLDTKKNKGETFVRRLTVHWFSASDEENPLQSKYYPLYEQSSNMMKKGNRRKVPRSELKHATVDEVDTDTVIVAFDSLTKRNTLPMSVIRRLAN